MSASARKGTPNGGGRPHVVGLACPDAADVISPARLLLDDLTAATAAYERRADMGDRALRLVELGTEDGNEPQVDALVLAVGVGAGASLSERDAWLGGALGHAPASSRVYALLTCDSFDFAEADAAATELERVCGEKGLAWSGALVVAGARTVTDLRRSPRLGWARRPVSEATDQLVLALRSGMATGTPRVRPGLARRAYAAVARVWRHVADR